MAFNILSTACISVAALCQTFPADPTKEKWKDDSSPGLRVNIHAVALAHAGINVALDLWMFILPLTQLYHIGLKTKKKIGVMLIFSLGFLWVQRTNSEWWDYLRNSLIVVSCVRIPFMVDFSRSLNSTGKIIAWAILLLAVADKGHYSRLAGSYCLVKCGERCRYPSGLSPSYCTTLTSCHDAREVHDTMLEVLWRQSRYLCRPRSRYDSGDASRRNDFG